jgi:hypothetical protein
LLVHVAEHVEADDHHRAAQSNKAMSGTEEWPIARVETAEERAFGDRKEQASDCCNDMACGVEEEELAHVSKMIYIVSLLTYLGDNEGLNEHDHAARNHCTKSNEIETAQNVENDVAWTSQMFS